MNLPDTVKALRELEVIDQRCGYVERAIMRGDPDRIEGEVRELARLMTRLTALVRKLYEHRHAQEQEKEAPAEVLTRLPLCPRCGAYHEGECSDG